MRLATLVAFDRPLAGVTLAGQGVRRHTDADLARQAEAAYQRGQDDARRHADGQIVELRSEVGQLRDGVFARIEALEPALLAQLRETLPALALDLARRLLAGFEPAPEVTQRICEEALAQIFPERENLELVVAPHDAALLENLQPHWSGRFPGLRITADPALRPGDCQVRSRFGLIDARLETKLQALQHSLSPA